MLERDSVEKTETVIIGGHQINRLVLSGYLSATDLYEDLKKYHRVNSPLGYKVNPYYFLYTIHHHGVEVKNILNNLFVMNYYLNQNYKGVNHSILRNKNSLIISFGTAYKNDHRKMRYYVHPVLFFAYYNYFDKSNRQVIHNYLYNEYFKQVITVGRHAQEWVKMLYDRYQNVRGPVKPYQYYGIQCRTLMNILGDHLLTLEYIHPKNLLVRYNYRITLISLLQMIDISMVESEYSMPDKRRQILKNFTLKFIHETNEHVLYKKKKYHLYLTPVEEEHFSLENEIVTK